MSSMHTDDEGDDTKQMQKQQSTLVSTPKKRKRVKSTVLEEKLSTISYLPSTTVAPNAYQTIEPIIIYKSTGFFSSFAYGLLVGQFTVLIVVAIFIRFFIFADPPSHRQPRQQRPVKVLPAASAGTNTILEKTYYNVESHAPESLDWFTVLIAQAISQVRDEAKTNDNILKSLDRVMNGDSIPDFVDTIKVTDLNIGDDYPIFSNCKIFQNNNDASGGLEAQMDVDLTDTITLGIETRLLLNFPKSLLAFLPVSLTVSIVRFSGRLTVSLRKNKTEPEDDNESITQNRTYLTFSFAPDYRLEFQVKSLVGARSRLQDVPKIGQVVESRLRKWFTDRCVEPRYQQIPLPSFWPRSKFTKEHGSATGAGGANSNTSPSATPSRTSNQSPPPSNTPAQPKPSMRTRSMAGERPSPPVPPASVHESAVLLQPEDGAGNELRHRRSVLQDN